MARVVASFSHIAYSTRARPHRAILCADDHRSARVMPPSPAARGCDEWSRGGVGRRRASLSSTAMRGPPVRWCLGKSARRERPALLAVRIDVNEEIKIRAVRRRLHDSPPQARQKFQMYPSNSKSPRGDGSMAGALSESGIPANLRGQNAAKTLRSPQKRRRPPLPATSTPTFVLD